MTDDPAERERRIAAAIEAGQPIDLRTGDAGRDDPARGATWGADRTVPAGFASADRSAADRARPCDRRRRRIRR
ncbi:hypothetical protein [Actinomadura alba]|uniref:Uncharacterized protein n=1 Tax=Actinomadura alba TaxID=406431 RepID=A0ABR7LME5_9ACTN|nr:hypothetical protein [Actinomadura alba]MBC6466021.1 hypothetical protein [Actinomadura alba]